MSERLTFRTLTADEIELRVGSVSAEGATLLLYKDARCDQAILDETVGPMNWERKHSRENANCTVSIWDTDKGAWVSKEDTGVESNTEKEKGLASDSFKRACTNWGLGRELYTSPFIFIPCETVRKENGRGFDLADKFMFSGAKVTDIGYDEKRRINRLVIADKNGVVMFSYPKGSKSRAEKPKDNDPVITDEQATALKDALEATNSDVAKFLAFVAQKSGKPIESVDNMTASQHKVAVAAINRKLSGGAN